jgi:energy-coupling factor transporter ATP-binding protein EcfA2
MRLRGLVFERFVTFERAEVNLCDESGAPLDVVLFVGESGTGKTALLRGIAGLLTEAAGASEELHEDYIRKGAETARCRVVFDDNVGGARLVVKLEKELGGEAAGAARGTPDDAFERWRAAIESEAAPRAAFSIASLSDDDHDDDEDEPSLEDTLVTTQDGDPLFDWLNGVRGTPTWDVAVEALERVLWPHRVHHLTPDGDLVFAGPAGLASSNELGDGFESVLVMALELLRLSTHRPDEELAYVIDDIDAHLHPRWQSRVIGDLRRAFPRVQLIATTHSPLVAASVEPFQVFRLDPPKGGAGTAINRVSDRLQKGANGSWSVMDHAFGAPDLPGPRWAQVPALPIRRDVLRVVDADLTRGAVVYAFPEVVYSREVKDAFGELALPGAPGATGHLFFIDLEPGVAWGHPCEYVFRGGDGKLSRHRAIWPPPNLDRFVPIGRG